MLSNENAELIAILNQSLMEKSLGIANLLEDLNDFKDELSESFSISSLSKEEINSLQVVIEDVNFKLICMNDNKNTISITIDSAKFIAEDEVEFIENENVMSLYEMKILAKNKRLFIEKLVEQINEL